MIYDRGKREQKEEGTGGVLSGLGKARASKKSGLYGITVKVVRRTA